MKKTGFEMGHDVKNRWLALMDCRASVLQSDCVPVNCATRRATSADAQPRPKRGVSVGRPRGGQKSGSALRPFGLLFLNHCLITVASKA